jgi:hypothetical protein
LAKVVITARTSASTAASVAPVACVGTTPFVSDAGETFATPA